MHRLLLTAALTLALALPAHAASRNAAQAPPEATPALAKAQPQAPSPARGEIEGFSGNLIVTPDADYQAKWSTPPETAPHFNVTDHVSEGGQLWVLPFFINPGVDAGGNAHVVCDVQVLRPNGTVSENPGQV